MKRMKLAVTIIAILSMVFMAACSSGGSSNGGGSAGGNTQNTNEGAKNEDQSKEEESAQTGKLVNPVVKVGSAAWFVPEKIPELAAAVKKFEEEYGGKVEWIEMGWGEQQDKLAAAVAAGEAWDLHWTEGFFAFPIWVTQGLLQPVDPYVDLQDPLWHPTIIEGAIFKGNHYGVGSVEYQQPYVYYFNKTLFEENGVKTPWEYYKEGNWNWETYSEVVRQMTLDTDGDGEIDQFGTYMNAFNPTIVSNLGSKIQFTEDGSLKAVIDSPNNRETYQMLQDLGYKNKAFNHGGNRFELFYSRKMAMMMEGTRMMLGLNGNPESGTTDEFGVVPLPMAPSSGGKYITSFNDSYWAIPTGAKNPEGAMLFAKILTETLKADTYKLYADALDADHLNMFDEVLAGMLPDLRTRIQGLGMPNDSAIIRDGQPVSELAAFQTELEGKVAAYNDFYGKLGK